MLSFIFLCNFFNKLIKSPKLLSNFKVKYQMFINEKTLKQSKTVAPAILIAKNINQVALKKL